MRTKLKILRIQHGFSQDKMALRLGFSRNQYQRIEVGNQEPTLKFLVALCNAFGMNLEEAKELTQLDGNEQAKNDRKTR